MVSEVLNIIYFKYKACGVIVIKRSINDLFVTYKLKKENMVEIPKIVYALIILVSLILVVTSHSKSFLIHILFFLL
jgi:hypothetical protein